jgi:putative addiction module component (TIGR02574 family)
MAATLKSLGIDRLDVEERLNLVEKIWDSIALDSGVVPLPDAQRAELERRYAEDEANPDDVLPWDEIKRSTLSALRK